MSVRGKVALVTGAASGIGLAVAERLAADGARVVRTDRAASGEVRELDVTREADWVRALDEVAGLGPLQILVHSAGISAGAPIVETSLEEWRRVLAINLDGAFLALRHGITAMRGHGRASSIVAVASASAHRAAPGAAAYCASKAALVHLCRVAALECRAGPEPIRVNSVSPAGVKTPLWRTMPFFRRMVEELGSEELAFAALEEQGGERFADAADVAAAIVRLCGDESAYITGTDVAVVAGSAPQPMRAHTRELLGHLDSCRAALRAAYDRVPASSRDRQPAAGRWSADEVVAHLALVGAQIAALLRRTLRTALAAGLPPARDDVPSVLGRMRAPELDRRRRKLTAPDAAVPSATPDVAAAWKALDAALATVRQVAQQGDDFDTAGIRAPHPLLGELDFLQWVAFFGLHEARHAEQLDELRGQFAD